MESVLLAGYLLLGLVTVTQALLLTLQTWEHRRYARSCIVIMKTRRHAKGHAVVFAPCKGADVRLEENLRALLRQDHHDYEVIFIVESENDPACETIRRVIAGYPWVPSRLLVAGRATDTGQKIHNLRAATAELPSQAKYLAFIDSDAEPPPEWLRALVFRMSDPRNGAVTGYRWLVPARDTLVNHVIYSINCGLMSLLGRSSHYLIWGGSWGLRREVFESIGLHAAWKGALSDDLMASRQLRRARLTVRFEPACVVASPTDYTAREMFSFLRRQYLMARYYTPDWWVFAFAASTLTTLLWSANVAALVAGLLWGTPLAWIPGLTLVAAYLLCIGRGSIRQNLIRTYFPKLGQALRRAKRFDVWANPLVGVVGWLGVASSMFGRHVRWRGVKYRVLPGGETRLVRRDGESSSSVGEEAFRQPSSDIEVRKSTTYRKAG